MFLRWCHRRKAHLQISIHHQGVVRRALKEGAFLLRSNRRGLVLFLLLRPRTVNDQSRRRCRHFGVGGYRKLSRKRG